MKVPRSRPGRYGVPKAGIPKNRNSITGIAKLMTLTRSEIIVYFVRWLTCRMY